MATNGMHYINDPFDGITKRECFAAQALEGILADWGEGDWSPEIAAASAVRHADALIAELNEEADNADTP